MTICMFCATPITRITKPYMQIHLQSQLHVEFKYTHLLKLYQNMNDVCFTTFCNILTCEWKKRKVYIKLNTMHSEHFAVPRIYSYRPKSFKERIDWQKHYILINTLI